MKRLFLLGGLSGIISQAQAQGPWSMVNAPTSNIFYAQNIVQVHSLSPTLMWGLTSERTTFATIPNSFVVTNNAAGAGNTYDFGDITVTGNATVGNISGVSATTAVAAAYPGPTFSGPASYGGEIVRTTNAGLTWTKVTTPTQFSGTGAFCNWVHMFNTTTGVALGNPTTAGGSFEILRTTDGGLTWSSAAGPAALPNERGQPGAFFASDAAPGTLWAGLASSVETNTVRTLKTTDYGQTWTVSNPVPNIVGAVTHLAFTANNLNGLAYGFTKTNGVVAALNVARTTDGGRTWVPITPSRTAMGSFFCNSIDAVGNRFYSTGPRDAIRPMLLAAEDHGTSYSTDGINWTNVSIAGTTLNTPGFFFCMDLIPLNGISPFAVGHGGLYTDYNGIGGIYKYNPSIVDATRDAVLQSTLTVSPNPSTSGVFSLCFGAPLKTGARLTVTDALGRQLLMQSLTAAATTPTTISLDLHREKPGIYTLQVRTDAGIATQKVVIE